MTLDILQFIDNKGGNAEEIRESQRKRGEAVELVDEVIQMYTDWVKSMFVCFFGENYNALSNHRDKWTMKSIQRGRR